MPEDIYNNRMQNGGAAGQRSSSDNRMKKGHQKQSYKMPAGCTGNCPAASASLPTTGLHASHCPAAGVSGMAPMSQQQNTLYPQNNILLAPPLAPLANAGSQDTQFLDYTYDQEGIATFDLKGKKKVQVKKYKGNILIDIREYYYDEGSKDLKPGKRGIALSLDSWTRLKFS